MSATPIPRTLMMTVFGDLNLSIISEMPKGRKAIITKIVAPENREKAYAFVQRNAMEVWKQGGDFLQRLKNDKEIRAYLSAQEIDACFDLSPMLAKVDYIFKRVFQKKNQ